MKKIILGIMALFIINGCGSSGKTKTVLPSDQCTHNQMSYLNDHYDPDNMMGAVTSLSAHKNGDACVKELLVGGTDVSNRATIMYSTLLYHYGLEDIPMGVNHRTAMRTTPSKITASPELDQFPHDGIPDSLRPDSVSVMCETLQDVQGKIKYVVGGHLHEIANLLAEKELCDGQQLISKKVSELIIATGGLDGKPETNLSEGQYRTTTTSIATKQVLANMPMNVPITMMDVVHIDRLRIGDEYKGTGTPMDFIYSKNIYGTYGEHSFGDAPVYLYAIYGTKLNGADYLTREKTCFNVNLKHGAVSLSAPCGKNHFVLRTANPRSERIMKDKIDELIRVGL